MVQNLSSNFVVWGKVCPHSNGPMNDNLQDLFNNRLLYWLASGYYNCLFKAANAAANDLSEWSKLGKL